MAALPYRGAGLALCCPAAPVPVDRAGEWVGCFRELCERFRAEVSPESDVNRELTRESALARLANLHATSAEFILFVASSGGYAHDGVAFADGVLTLQDMLVGMKPGRPFIVAVDASAAGSLVYEAKTRQLRDVVIVAACGAGEVAGDGNFLPFLHRMAVDQHCIQQANEYSAANGRHMLSYVGTLESPIGEGFPLPGRLLYHQHLLALPPETLDLRSVRGRELSMRWSGVPQSQLALVSTEGTLLQSVAAIDVYEVESEVVAVYLGECGGCVSVAVTLDDVKDVMQFAARCGVSVTDNTRKDVIVPAEAATIQKAIDSLSCCGGRVLLCHGSYSESVSIDKPVELSPVADAREVSIESSGVSSVEVLRGGEASQIRGVLLSHSGVPDALQTDGATEIATCVVRYGSPVLHEVVVTNNGGGSGVWVEPSAGHVTLQFCEVVGCVNRSGGAFAVGINCEGGSTSIIETSVMGNAGAGVWAAKTARVTCRGMTRIEDNQVGACVENCARLQMDGQSAVANNAVGGIALWDKGAVDLHGTSVTGNVDFGLWLEDDSAVSATAARVDDNVRSTHDVFLMHRSRVSGDLHGRVGDERDHVIGAGKRKRSRRDTIVSGQLACTPTKQVAKKPRRVQPGNRGDTARAALCDLAANVPLQAVPQPDWS
eukprot:TRINITY_DN6474_c0_g1_i1.p1 TRINITY_DN6474_c0_g1~~TRINITY_DN6474_c0_g1_i1.p1  ORF type:complete len:660 (+),score=144.77 TRINITY_DN6474_c0_g1_i1:80-2059(+)